MAGATRLTPLSLPVSTERHSKSDRDSWTPKVGGCRGVSLLVLTPALTPLTTFQCHIGEAMSLASLHKSDLGRWAVKRSSTYALKRRWTDSTDSIHAGAIAGLTQLSERSGT